MLSTGETLEQLKPSRISSGNANDTTTLKNSLAVSYKVKHIWCKYPSPGYLLKRNKNLSHKKIRLWILIAALFIIAPNWKNPDVLVNEQTIKRTKNCEAKTDRSRTRSPRSFQLSKVGDSSSKRLKIKFGVYGLPEKHCLEDVGAYCYILNIRWQILTCL